MTFVSLALLGSLRERKRSEVANIKSNSSGPKDGEHLLLYFIQAKTILCRTNLWMDLGLRLTGEIGAVNFNRKMLKPNTCSAKKL
jgi:hypothetical protein